MRWLPAIILAVAILLAPVVWHLSRSFLVDTSVAPGTSAVDSGARIDIELMRGELAALRAENEQMRADIAALSDQIAAVVAQGRGAGTGDAVFDDNNALYDDGDNSIIDAYAQVVLIADRRNVNRGLNVPSRSYLIETLGRPRDELSDECQSVTNPAFAARVFQGDVGPIKVRMLQPAVESLTRVFERVRETDQDLYDRINTSGSLCVRRIRGTQSTYSSHAFGLALDLNIDGRLDNFADGRTQLGLTILADFFREEGWIWGAGFSREDSMHFEVSRELLEEWRAQGLI
ncbi:M15 family metallopeptidase [Tropicimonas sp. S265A]|uniref:M15 family metallopeptidase n=1 Tax=Tropicimonas sp. S265A TaxID=3415134 RepID=UPI003C7AFC21